MSWERRARSPCASVASRTPRAISRISAGPRSLATVCLPTVPGYGQLDGGQLAGLFASFAENDLLAVNFVSPPKVAQ